MPLSADTRKPSQPRSEIQSLSWGAFPPLCLLHRQRENYHLTNLPGLKFSPPPLHPFCSYHLSRVAFSQCHLPFAGRWRAALYCLPNNSLQFAVRYFFRTPLILFFFHLLLLIFSLHTICVCSPKLFIFLKALLWWYFFFECPFLDAKPSLPCPFPSTLLGWVVDGTSCHSQLLWVSLFFRGIPLFFHAHIILVLSSENPS